MSPRTRYRSGRDRVRIAPVQTGRPVAFQRFEREKRHETRGPITKVQNMKDFAEEIAEFVVPTGSAAVFWLGGGSVVFKSASGKIVYVDPYLTDYCEKTLNLKRPLSISESRYGFIRWKCPRGLLTRINPLSRANRVRSGQRPDTSSGIAAVTLRSSVSGRQLS